MNKNALFCDGTSDYVIPAEPGIHEKVRLRFRTARDDAQEVCLISGGEALQMQKISSGEVFDYYETEVQLTDTMFVYYFRINCSSFVCITPSSVYRSTRICKSYFSRNSIIVFIIGEV